ncbi:MAG: HipA N-terminal domain-containing protein [Rhodothermales bacterium]
MTPIPTLRQADIFVHDTLAGILASHPDNQYSVTYRSGYTGAPISLTMPVRPDPYLFDRFPPFFDNLLPEGWQLDALLRKAKLDKHDYLGQLLVVGGDLVGAVTIYPIDTSLEGVGVDEGVG